MESEDDALWSETRPSVAHVDSACKHFNVASPAVDTPAPSPATAIQPPLSSSILIEVIQLVRAALGLCTLCATGSLVLTFWSPSTEQRTLFLRSALVGFALWWCLLFTQADAQRYLGWAESSAWLMALLLWTVMYPDHVHPVFPPWITNTVVTLAILSIFSAFALTVASRFDRANAREYQVAKCQSPRLRQRARDTATQCLSDEASHQRVFLNAVAQELQSAALMVIATLEQFSPATILANTHELLSACSIAVPISSVSAINTTIKQVYYISSHLNLVSRLLNEKPEARTLPTGPHKVFDASELLQNVGDALGGVAAKQDITLVICHSDTGLHATNVVGDEDAVRHGLLNLFCHVLRQCTAGACIELGLSVNRLPSQRLSVVYEMCHTASLAIKDPPRLVPFSQTSLTAQLLDYIDASFTIDEVRPYRTRFRVALEMPRSNEDEPLLTLDETDMHSHYASFKFSNEPTLNDLTAFIGHLKGLKMVLHAPERSVLAKHLTSCLASWNTDISHVPILHPPVAGEHTDVSNLPRAMQEPHLRQSSADSHGSLTTTITSPRSATTPPVPSPVIEEEHLHAIPPAFLLIDDDIATLERKLREFRTQPPASANMLQNHQHTRRHKRGKPSTGPHQNFFHHGMTAIIHFTSLTRYKHVRDSIQLFATALTQPFAMPRVVVVPKPAGPRRFLTALHTAWNDAMVGPHFLPIATSPSSPVAPGVSMMMAMFQHTHSPHTPPGNHHFGVASPPSHDMEKRSPGNTRRPGPDNYFCGSSPHDASDLPAKLTVGRRRSRTEASTPPTHTNTHPSSDHHVNGGLAQGAPSGGSPLQMVMGSDTRSSEKEAVSPTSKKKGGNHTSRLASPKGCDPTMNSDKHTDVGTEPSPSAKKLSIRNMAKLKKKKKEKSAFNVVSPPINVLIVEDNMINQAILSAWMRKHKIKYSVASNGQEAVEKWQAGGFHLVLMDIQLPVMDGIEATKMIRSIEKEEQIGVLPMSSSFLQQQQQLQQQGEESGQSHDQDQVQVQDPAQGDLQPHPQQDEPTHPHSHISQASPSPRQALYSHPPHPVDHDSSSTTAFPLVSIDAKTRSSSTEPVSTFRSPVIIVALTASSLESDRHAALAAGCNDFLTKPVSLEWLDKKITEWGCMQALIDFEGWRRWRRSTAVPPSKAPPPSSTAPLLPPPPPPSPHSPAPTSPRLSRVDKSRSGGILLLGASGAHKRRSSTASGGTNKHWAWVRTRMKKSHSEETGGQKSRERGEEEGQEEGEKGTTKKKGGHG